MNLAKNKILITGVAGFIGLHTAKRLLDLGYAVYGIDNLNAYYDVRLKLDRLKELGIDIQSDFFLRQKEVVSETYSEFMFHQLDLTDEYRLELLFEKERFDIVVHLAAQAGVRYSIDNPKVYIQSNVVGFFNVLEASRQNKTRHFIYASSSSVYGNQIEVPFSEDNNVDKPVSLYAATKKSDELIAHVYSHLYGLPTTGLRFFTVYGPWGRPDMAPFLFTKSILEQIPIKVFNNGNLTRDFTYIDDVVDGIMGIVTNKVKVGDYKIFNIGNNQPTKLLDFISIIEKHCNEVAQLEMCPMQDGDVFTTYADTRLLFDEVGFRATTSIDFGLKQFINWFKNYYEFSK